MTFGHAHEYATWDAAYALGSLPGAERREYEAHLSTCAPCRLAVKEVYGVLAMLRRLGRDDVAAIDDVVDYGWDNSAPRLTMERTAKVNWRPRPARMLNWAIAAAVLVVVMVGVVFTCQATLAQSSTWRAGGTLLTVISASNQWVPQSPRRNLVSTATVAAETDFLD